MPRYFTYAHKRYIQDSKAFERLVNAERKQGNRVFDTLTINGTLYVPNPITTGKGSQNAFVAIETNAKGQPTKRGQATLNRMNNVWTASHFVQDGEKYVINWEVQYNIERTLKNGETVKQTRQALFPARAHSLPAEFGRGGIFTASRNMSRNDLLNYLIVEVLQKQFGADSDVADVQTLKLSAEPVRNLNLADTPMNSVKMLYKSIDNNKETRPGSCVADYILSELHKPSARLQHIKRTDVEHLKTTNEIIEWAQKMGCVSVYALNPLFKVFEKHISNNTRATLIFVCNNNHLYPITNDTQRRKVIQCDKLELQEIDMLKVDMENVIYYEDENEPNVFDMVDFVERAAGNVVLPVDSLEPVAVQLMKQTNTLVECFNFYNGNLSTFKHPTRDILIIAGRDFVKRREICTHYFNKFKVIDFKFANQSWGEIGRLILENCFNVVPRSNYSPELMEIFKNYPIVPYRMYNGQKAARYTTVDMRGCYSSILENSEEVWNIGGTFDTIRPFVVGSELVPGEYYISRDFYMGNGTIFISKGFYPLNFVKYAIAHNYITANDLTHSITADKHLKSDTFRQFVKDMFELYPQDAKNIVNMLIGCFGSLYHRTCKAAITTDFETAAATVCDVEHAKIYEVNDLYIIQQNTQSMKTSGDMPIYRQVIAASLCKLDEMVRILNPQKIISYNTDSVKFCGSFNEEYVKQKSECNRGEYHVEPSKALTGRHISQLDRHTEYIHKVPQVRHIEETAINYDDVLNGGALIMGGAGCGKSHLIVQMLKSMTAEDLENTAVITYTNAAAENLKKRGCTTTQTLNSLLWVGDKLSISPLQKYKRVILDEFGMLPPYEMGLLLNAKNQFGLSVVCVGDPNQCKAPVDNFIEYHTNSEFLNMCNNTIINMAYKPGFARYDMELYNALTHFLTVKNLDGWDCDEVATYQNICFSNKKRDEINQQCLARWVAEKNTKLVNFGFPVAVGLPVMCYDEADKVQKVFKTHIFNVVDIGNDVITLKNEVATVQYDRTQFRKLFDYAFAFTVHKCQGITIEGHFNIYEAHLMSWSVLYTAMSRGTRREFVHIVSKRWGQYLDTVRPASIEHITHTVKLKQGTIYEIALSNGSFYIGKTNKTVAERLAEHLTNPTNDEMATALDASATIRELETFFYKSEKVFRMTEEQHIKNAIENGMILANVQHNKKADATPAKLSVSVKRPNITILECKKYNRFIINLRRTGVDSADRVKYFPFGDCKAAALKAAEAHREYLLLKYY